MKSLDDDSHVKTRLCQYEAYNEEKGVEIAKQLVLGKIQGQNGLLRKYGFNTHDLDQITHFVENARGKKLSTLRPRLMQIEGTATKKYFG
jgi:CRISPR/Cas system-associated endonuclease Cas1